MSGDGLDPSIPSAATRRLQARLDEIERKARRGREQVELEEWQREEAERRRDLF